MLLSLKNSKVAASPVKIYHTNKGEKPNSYAGLIALNRAESRYALAEGAIDFVCKELKMHPLDLEAVVKERIARAYQLVAVGFTNLYEEYLEAGVDVDAEIAKVDVWLSGYIEKLRQYFPETVFNLLCKELSEERDKFDEGFSEVRAKVIEEHNRK